jgi:hypothetical protein
MESLTIETAISSAESHIARINASAPPAFDDPDDEEDDEEDPKKPEEDDE